MTKKQRSFVFVVCIILVCSIGAMAIMSVGNIFDSLESSLKDSETTIAIVDEDDTIEADDNVSGGVATEGEDASDPDVPSGDDVVPHVLSLSNHDFTEMYHISSDETTAYASLGTTALKANTKYMLTWEIDPDFMSDTTAKIDQIYSGDELKYAIYLNIDAHNTSGLGTAYLKSDIDSCLSNSISFTTGAAGSGVRLYMFSFPHTGAIDTTDLAYYLLTNYVKTFTFTEIL